MKFGTFQFPNDPEKLHLSFAREYKVSATSSGQWSVSSPARLGCTVEGEGVFFGTSAMSSFDTLLNYLQLGTSMTLTIPGRTDTFPAILVRLELTEEACESCLHYRFVFVQTPT